MRAKEYRQLNKDKPKKQRKIRQCWICKQVIPPGLVSVDHLVPRSKGGTNAAWNLRYACKPCNFERGNTKLDVRQSMHQYRGW